MKKLPIIATMIVTVFLCSNVNASPTTTFDGTFESGDTTGINGGTAYFYGGTPGYWLRDDFFGIDARSGENAFAISNGGDTNILIDGDIFPVNYLLGTPDIFLSSIAQVDQPVPLDIMDSQQKPGEVDFKDIYPAGGIFGMSYITLSLNVNPGEMLKFSWNWVSSDGADFSYFIAEHESGTYYKLFAKGIDANIDVPTLPYDPDAKFIVGLRHTDWNDDVFMPPVGGNWQFSFGSASTVDGTFESILLLDEITVAHNHAIPILGSLYFYLIGLFSVAILLYRK